MEELKQLLELVANLPALAIWVLVGFFAYKTIIIGSIYGVIRTGMTLLHSWATKPKLVEFTLNGEPINNSTANLLKAQLARIHNTNYIHASDVKKLEVALDIVELCNNSHKLTEELSAIMKEKKNARFSTTKC